MPSTVGHSTHVGHGRSRLLGRSHVALVSAPPPEPVGQGSIYLGRRPNVSVESLLAASAAAAPDDIADVLATGGHEG